MITASQITAWAASIGFDACGIAPASRLERQHGFFSRWLAAGHHDRLGYLERDPEKRFDPGKLFPGARTVVVCGVNGGPCRVAEPPRVAAFALCRDYHLVIKEMLGELLGRVQDHEPGAKGRICVDSSPINEKSWAVQACLGAIGRNSLLIVPGLGSRAMLGVLVLDCGVENDLPAAVPVADPCGGCRRCVMACPAGAINPDRSVDLRRCISRRTMEKGAEAPAAELHGWIMGCEECQACCPHNAEVPPSRFFVPKPGTEDPGFWREMTPEQYVRVLGDTPMARTPWEVLRKRLEDIAKNDTFALNKE